MEVDFEDVWWTMESMVNTKKELEASRNFLGLDW